MAPARLRAWRPSDARAVRRLVETVLREHGLWASHKPGLDDLLRPRAVYAALLVVEAGGRVVGCGGLTKDGAVQRMYLLKPWRGRGLGAALLTALIARARKRGLTRLRLETAPRLKAAIALYRSFGFEQTAIGSDCCSVKMSLPL